MRSVIYTSLVIAALAIGALSLLPHPRPGNASITSNPATAAFDRAGKGLVPQQQDDNREEPSSRRAATQNTGSTPSGRVQRSDQSQPALIPDDEIAPSRSAKSRDRKVTSRRASREQGAAIAATPAPLPSGPMGLANPLLEQARLQPGSWHAQIAQAAAEAPAEFPAPYHVDRAKLRDRFPDAPPEQIEALQRDFEKAAGVGELDPASPEYDKRWREASLTTSTRLRTLYGWGADAAMQRQAVLDAMNGSK